MSDNPAATQSLLRWHTVADDAAEAAPGRRPTRCTLATVNTFRRRRRRPRAGRAALVGLAVALALTASACTGGSGAVDQTAGTEFRFTDATEKGDVIPVADRRSPGDVGGELLDGSGTYSLTADAGKVVVINLWASWCGPCKVETPQFEQVYQQTKAEGVQFVGFDVKDNRQDAQAFVTDNQVTYPMVYDQPAKVVLQLGNLPVQGLPLTVVIDRQGKVAAAYVGLTQPSDLKPAIATLVAES